MLVRASSLPFLIVMLASVIPWVTAYFDSKLLALTPDLLLILLFVALLISDKVSLRTGALASTILIVTVAHSLIGIIDGRGIGSGGLVLLVIEVFIFYKLFATAKEGVSSNNAYVWVARIYKVHLGFLIFELLMCLAGFTELFVAIAGHSTVTSIYKTYNTAGLLQYYGIMNGLNSLILGSQSASQLSLFSAIWLYMFAKVAPTNIRACCIYIWVVAAITMYALSATMTSNIILIILSVFLIYMFYRFRLSCLSLILILISMIFLATSAEELVFFRINNVEDWGIYLQSIETPLEVFASISSYRQLLGWGAYFDENIISDTNFGLGALVFQVGLLMSSLFMLFAIYFVRKVILMRKVYINSEANIKSELFIGIMNGLFAIGWFISLTHYTPAIELGGRQLFAFHIALSIYYWRRTSTYNQARTGRASLCAI